jgi:DNA-directed RNA polymerase specialized sigma subunit
VEKLKTQPSLREVSENLPDSVLKEVSKNWNLNDWNEYLKTIEGTQSEKLFAKKNNKLQRGNVTDSVFCLSSDYQLKKEHRRLIRRVLKTLTKMQRKVLKKIIFDDFSQAEIALNLNISEPAIFYHKEAALKRLSEHPELLNFLHLMREEKNRKSLRPSKKTSELLEIYYEEVCRRI